MAEKHHNRKDSPRPCQCQRCKDIRLLQYMRDAGALDAVLTSMKRGK